MKKLIFFLLVFISNSLYCEEGSDLYSFNNDIDYERFNSLNKELRCPKCQSSSLDGSNSPISKDLKNQVHKLILEGKTDDEIKSYLIARYGDYIVYEPRFNSTTLVLWVGPFIFLFLVLFIAFYLNMRKSIDVEVK